ncbi:MAG: HDIG domain-containing protein [Syntrophobacterales bacterium]|nr:MAG: HDIG domain-containing protein [Syntrophobacterales bacterium]
MDDEGLRKAKRQNSRAKKKPLPLKKLGDFKTLYLAPIYRNPTAQKWMIGITSTIILALLLSPTIRLPSEQYRIGDVASADIKSTQDFLVEDENATLVKRDEAKMAVLSVYDYDPSILQKAMEKTRASFSFMRDYVEFDEVRGQEAERGKELGKLLGVTFTSKEFDVLAKTAFGQSVEDVIIGFVQPLMRKGIVGDRDFLAQEKGRGIVVRNVQTQTERIRRQLDTIIDSAQAEAIIKQNAKALSKTIRRELRPVLVKIASHLMEPNLTFNRNETEARKTAAFHEVKPVLFQIKKGEMLVREGERITNGHLIKLQALKALGKEANVPLITMGLFFLILMIVYLLYTFSTKNIRKISLNSRNLVFVSLNLITIVLALKVFIFISESIESNFLSIASSSYYYLFPVVAGAMLTRIVINSEVAIVYSIIASMFSAIILDNSLFFFIYAFIGSIVGANGVARCEQRSTLIKAGLHVGVANALLIVFYEMFRGTLGFEVLFNSGFGFIGGILSAIIVLGTTPIVEGIFGYTTDITLLELANLDQPILKDLIVQAPGTYHHSIIVGSLAEAAAKAINVNPLLARVSAYYHDIGKIKKALYFSENQGGKRNPHDKLSPSMSSLILNAHVKDGVELAKGQKLGKKILDIIQQHHGTSLISFFYQKAKEKENPGVESINEKDYRYLGPRPQTKEAGIVMLADAVEAASKTLSDPTPSRVKGLVSRIINTIFTDGQLEDCELTLKDLHHIEESFDRILTGIFHQRVEYPDSGEEQNTSKKEGDEGTHSRSTKPRKTRQKDDQKVGPNHLKRVESPG